MPFRLPHSQLLELSGADAASFAQAQFINDIKQLAVGDWQWSGWLTPKGRLICFFAVVRRNDDTYLMWLPTGGAEELRERLQRYVFRSKLSLAVRSDWTVLGRFDEELPALAPVLHLELPADAHERSRQLLVLPQADLDTITDADAKLVERWHLADLRLGLPYIAAGSANSEQFVPQWLSLERLNAFSLSKGCYPGQEIVARMHYLGQSKRAAFHLGGVGTAPSAMARVLDAQGNGIGEIVWSQQASADGNWQALAVLATDKATSVASIEGGSSAALM